MCASTKNKTNKHKPWICQIQSQPDVYNVLVFWGFTRIQNVVNFFLIWLYCLPNNFFHNILMYQQIKILNFICSYFGMVFILQSTVNSRLNISGSAQLHFSWEKHFTTKLKSKKKNYLIILTTNTQCKQVFMMWLIFQQALLYSWDKEAR